MVGVVDADLDDPARNAQAIAAFEVRFILIDTNEERRQTARAGHQRSMAHDLESILNSTGTHERGFPRANRSAAEKLRRVIRTILQRRGGDLVDDAGRGGRPAEMAAYGVVAVDRRGHER